MSQLIFDQKEIDFILYELLRLYELVREELFSDFSKKSFDMISSATCSMALGWMHLWRGMAASHCLDTATKEKLNILVDSLADHKRVSREQAAAAQGRI